MSHLKSVCFPTQASAPELLPSVPYRCFMAHPATRTRFALGATSGDVMACGEMLPVAAISNVIDPNLYVDVGTNFMTVVDNILATIAVYFPNIINR